MSLDPVCRRIRGTLVELSHRAKVPHLASSLSCVEMIVAAYWGVLAIDPAAPQDPDRDRFILSKGHAATTLYTALAMRGFFPEALLDTFAEPGGVLPEHPSPGCVPGVEVATGSLGHGLPIAVGIALAGKLQARPFRTVVVMSDGECNEGTVWEAAMFAPVHRLDRLTIVVDYNKWQATGRSDEVMALSPLRDKWEAFGWDAVEADGHDLDALIALLRRPPDAGGRPRAIVAHTVKGKGVSFMEDDNNWHYRIPTADEVARAHVELGLTEQTSV
jgi:transketolase